MRVVLRRGTGRPDEWSAGRPPRLGMRTAGLVRTACTCTSHATRIEVSASQRTSSSASELAEGATRLWSASAAPAARARETRGQRTKAVRSIAPSQGESFERVGPLEVDRRLEVRARERSCGAHTTTVSLDERSVYRRERRTGAPSVHAQVDVEHRRESKREKRRGPGHLCTQGPYGRSAGRPPRGDTRAPCARSALLSPVARFKSK